MTYHTHEQVMAGAVERIITRHALSRRDVLAIVLFLADRSLVRGIFDYVRGVGPAAQAAGRAGVRTHPVAPHVVMAPIESVPVPVALVAAYEEQFYVLRSAF